MPWRSLSAPTRLQVMGRASCRAASRSRTPRPWASSALRPAHQRRVRGPPATRPSRATADHSPRPNRGGCWTSGGLRPRRTQPWSWAIRQSSQAAAFRGRARVSGVVAGRSRRDGFGRLPAVRRRHAGGTAQVGATADPGLSSLVGRV
jgi:hypothetical protein